MLRIASFTAFALFAATTAQAAERPLDLTGMRGLVLNAGITAEITSTTGPLSVKLIGEKKIINNFYVTKNEAIYNISYDHDKKNADENLKSVKLIISTPYMTYFSNARGGVVHFNNFKTKGILLEQGYNGFTDFEGENFGGSVTLEGTCDAINIGFRGPGFIDAKNFKCQTAWIGAEGSGQIELYASEAFKSQLTGSTSVSVLGNPQYCLARTTGKAKAQCGDRMAETFAE